LACILAACGSSHEKLDLGGTCILNSDCNEPLLCKFGACHKACVRSVDCENGGHCVVADGVAVCETQSESTCSANGTCATGLVCRTVDNTCRSACSPTNDISCMAGQTCNGTVCLENKEVANPGTDASAGAGDAASGPDAGSTGPDVPAAQPDAASADVSLAKPDSVSPGLDTSADRTTDLAGGRDGIVQPPDGAPILAGGLTVDMAMINFGSVDQGETVTKTVTVTNTGLPAVVSPQVTGAGYIIQSTTCAPVALATNGSCTITVALSPAVNASGGASGTLTIGTGAGAIAVPLSGTVMAPGTFSASLSILPATALVNQAVPFNVTVTPSGPLSDLSCLAAGPDVDVDPVAADTTCAATLSVPAVASCVYAFIFKAAKAGIAMDKITCFSNGKVQDLPVSVNVLSPASLTISPSPVAFAAVVGATSDAVILRVRNNGTASSGAVSAALGGTGAGQFTMTDNQCSGVLVGLASCTIAVVYKPTAAGAVTASLTVTDATAGSTPAVATLTGTAVTEAILAITGAQDLGSVTVGQAGTPSTFTLTNSGGAASDAVAIGATDPQFAIANNLCGPPLAAAATCTFTVIFTPTSGGLKTAVLTAKSGNVLSGQKQIQGTGVAALAPP
jgi:hypothetical protein